MKPYFSDPNLTIYNADVLAGLAMIAQYRLPADTPDHVTDSIYRGDWLNHQLKSNHFKTIKEIEE